MNRRTFVAGSAAVIGASKSLISSAAAQKPRSQRTGSFSLPKVILVDDMATIGYFAHPPSRQDIENYVKNYANNGIDALVFDLANVDVCPYRSKVTETWPPRDGVGLEEPIRSTIKYPIKNVWHLIDNGIDLPAVLAESCHRHGMQFWAGIRLNTSNYATRFKQEHPDAILPMPFPGALDYEKPYVRARVLAVARELVEDYGADGLSLNFVRYQKLFHPDRAYQNLDLLTRWLGEVRQMLDEAAKKRGKARLPLAAQVMSRIPDGRIFGHDYPAWAQKGLVDLLCPGRENHMDFNIPLETWMEAIRSTDCQIYPVLQPNLGYPMGTVDSQMTLDKFRAAAHTYYQGGAHGLFTMNILDVSLNPVFLELRDPDKVANGFHHYHYASPPFSSFDGNLNYSLEPNVERQDYRFRLGTDPSKRKPGLLRVSLESVHPTDIIEIDLNRTPLPKVPGWDLEGTAFGEHHVHPRTLVERQEGKLGKYRYEASLQNLPLRQGENSLGFRMVSRGLGVNAKHPTLRGIELLL